MLESKFSASVVSALRHKGYMVNKIESHGTVIGIPDLYCVCSKPFWIELKVVNKDTKGKDKIEVPYRTGQLAWITRHKSLCHKMNIFTLVKTLSEIWCINNSPRISNENSRVFLRSDINVYTANSLVDAVTCLGLANQGF